MERHKTDGPCNSALWEATYERLRPTVMPGWRREVIGFVFGAWRTGTLSSPLGLRGSGRGEVV